MPIDDDATCESLFLFAHQDDEFGVFDRIAHACTRGRTSCAYITDGAAGGAPTRRNRESMRVLQRLGVRQQNVHFLGQQHGIGDGKLHAALPAVATALEQVLAQTDPEALVYVPAWEGGHPDHDGLHAVAAVLLDRQRRLQHTRQFPLYNAFRRAGPLFRVLTPLADNGEAEIRRLPWRDRMRHLRSCLGYPSQASTWAGLLPFVAAHVLWRGRLSLQPVQLRRIAERPHAGPLYYEKRGFLRFEQLLEAVTVWRASDGRRAATPLA